MEGCQNEVKNVLEMDVPQVSLKLSFRGQERPSLQSIDFISGINKHKADAPQDRDLTKAVAIVLLLFRSYTNWPEVTLFRIRAAKPRSFVDTILNAKKQSQNKSPICALANGAFLRLFLGPRPVTSRYLDIDHARLKPTAVTVIHDGRAIDDPKIISEITTLIAARKNWDLSDYTVDVLPEAGETVFAISELKATSPGMAEPAERSIISSTPGNPAFLANRHARNLCPYKGLFAFWEQDADVFFGRESLIQLLTEKLDQKHIVQVSGPSGSGKSSLVAAGLIPALKDSGTWQVLYCRPGNDPFASLASALMPHLKPSEDEISRAAQLPKLREVLEQGQLNYLLRQAVAANDDRALLLFIDQFEELYTQCNTQTLRDRFLDTLLTLMSADAVASAPRIRLVYTIRADFTNRLFSHRGFTDAIQDADVKIGPMNREELDSVIRRPASLHNVRFEEGLAERILNDAGVEPSTLPLLEFALAELWERQTEGMLTHAGYERIGQLSGAIAHQAEKVIRGLGQSQQEVARHILARLVRLADESGEHTRQRVSLAALYSEELLNKDAGRKVLDQLTQARLVTVAIASDQRQQMVEIAHEALVRRWPRLKQWLEEDREILVWRQRLDSLIQGWQQTGRDDGFLLRGSLLDEAKLWLTRRSNDLTPVEKDFINASLKLQRRERTNRALGRFELLVANSGSDLQKQSAESIGAREAIRLAKDLPFLARPGTWRLQISVIPVSPADVQNLRPRLAHLPISTVLPLLSAAAPAELATDLEVSSQEMAVAQKLDDQTLALLKDLQLQGASGLALELISPQLDGIPDPTARLKFASILFDMMHVRGRYADAAELIRQELALYPPNAEVHSPLLLPLKIRFLHHQMFYRPVTELWPQMGDLLNCCDPTQDPESYGDILFMLGGNLGTLRGNYQEARRFLIRAIAHAKQRKDHYILARSLRKYGDFLRNHGHFNFARDVLLEALRLSGRGRGTRQRIYILGCLGDLERQRKNHAAASEHFDRAIELARATFIPGWLGNLHLGLAELALDRNRFDDAKISLEQAEAHYRNTHPKHWWGEIQVGLSRCRLMRMSGSQDWTALARTIHAEAIAAGYSKDAALAGELLKGRVGPRNALMFL
ncbi:MAG: tetratricopeptide repeat protein [Verrucomicrobia bacterium]|nr:tetratricopeptide repeat protein [Verrucomicrobiota bacterium]